MPEEKRQADPPPVAVFAQVEPEGLLGHVRVPDQEVLRKGDVGPEHREGQHELADGMQMVVVEDAPVVAPAKEPDHHEHADREGAADAGGKKVDAVDGGEPVVFETLEPVDRRQR